MAYVLKDPDAYVFGNFVLDLRRSALRKDGRDIKLRRQSFEVLKILLENQGSLVSKETLRDEVWKDAVVTRDSLTQCLVEIRKAIGDTNKRVIRTVPRQGYIFDESVSSIPSPGDTDKGPVIGQDNQPWVALVAALAIAVAVSWLFVQPGDDEAGSVPAQPPEKSIAVLPFLDLSDEQNLKYFGESLSEEIINRLAQSPDLHVLGRTSSFSFRNSDADVRAISDQLKTHYLLEGSVRQSNEDVRVMAQLIDATNDKHVWSKAFDTGLHAATHVQSEIALAVAEALEAELGGLSTVSNTTDPATFNLFGHARQIINSRELDQLPVAIELLQEALRRDPSFIRAMTELSRAYYQQRLTDQVTWDEALQNAFPLTDAALALAPDDPIANAWTGWREFFHERNFDAAADHYRRAFAAAPTNVDIIRGAIPVWLASGRVEEAVQLAEYVVAHDPLCMICQRFMVSAYITAEQFDTAEAHVRTMLHLYPGRADMQHELAKIKLLQGETEEAHSIIKNDRPNADAWLVTSSIVYHRLGLMDEYERALQPLLDLAHEFPIGLVLAYSATGNHDEAFRWLRSYYETTKFHGLVGHDPLLKPLRDDPRWREIRAEFSLSEEQFAALDFPTNLPR